VSRVNGPDRQAFTDGYDEARDEAGVPRPGYDRAFRALEGVDLERLHRDVADAVARSGLSFGSDPFVVDPMPRLLPTADWNPLAAGLVQRSVALNHFLRDAYGAQRIVSAGVVPGAMIEAAEGFEPDLMGRLPERSAPAAIIGFDVVRNPDGEFLVLEDNARTPSGFGYALAARAALSEILPAGFPDARPIDPITYELLAGVFKAAAPTGSAAPTTVVLTDGPDNVAYSEQAAAARRLGVPLVTLADLVREGNRLSVDLGAGRTRPVDVVYRRTNEDRIRDERGELTAVARVLLAPWLTGQIGLVNAFGNGLADDKLVHSRVEDMIRFYLGEEPLVRSVPTHTAEEGGASIDELRKLVVKPRHGHGGVGVVIGAHAETDDLRRLARELETHPDRYITQPIVPLSRHPTIIDAQLQPRHVDLRPFAFCGDAVSLIPGGLTRVALEAGALVVNSSQRGGGKDTWVID
jgi:uncharacterized circularly permuted ATP-grasp superfamily protein